MKTMRYFLKINSGASGIHYHTAETNQDAYQWIKHNLTEAQQACVKVTKILIEVETLAVSRP